MGLGELTAVDVLVSQPRDRERPLPVQDLLAADGPEPGSALGEHAVAQPQVRRMLRHLARGGIERPHLSDQH